MSYRCWFASLGTLLALSGCRQASEPTVVPQPVVTLRIAAAADLRFAFDGLSATYRTEHPHVKLEPVFGASGALSAQIRHGAPFDVFLSADMAYPGKLATEGLTTSAPKPYARGALVIWAPTGQTPGLEEGGAKALLDASVSKVALASPEHAPYGRAALAALGSLGLAAKLNAKLVVGENVSQAAQFAASGAAQAAFISRSLAASAQMAGKGRFVPAPAGAYPPLIQGAVVIRASRSREAAAEFVAWLTSADGVAALGKAGLEPPSGGRS